MTLCSSWNYPNNCAALHKRVKSGKIRHQYNLHVPKWGVIKVNNWLCTYSCYFRIKPLGTSKGSSAVTDTYKAKLHQDMASPVWAKGGMCSSPAFCKNKAMIWDFLPCLFLFRLLLTSGQISQESEHHSVLLDNPWVSELLFSGHWWDLPKHSQTY